MYSDVLVQSLWYPPHLYETGLWLQLLSQELQVSLLKLCHLWIPQGLSLKRQFNKVEFQHWSAPLCDRGFDGHIFLEKILQSPSWPDVSGICHRSPYPWSSKSYPEHRDTACFFLQGRPFQFLAGAEGLFKDSAGFDVFNLVLTIAPPLPSLHAESRLFTGLSLEFDLETLSEIACWNQNPYSCLKSPIVAFSAIFPRNLILLD